MEYLVGFGAVMIFLWWLYGIIKENQRDDEYKPQEDVNKDLYDKALAQMKEERDINVDDRMHEDNENVKGTRDLFLETLTKIGCQYELAEEVDDDRIFFAYQGENFFVSARNDLRYIHIYDTHWGHVELYDIDEFARLKKVINGSNLNNSVVTVYTVDEEGKNVDVHSKSTILFIPQIPDIENYLRLELNEFFNAHRYVSNEMAKLREQEANVR